MGNRDGGRIYKQETLQADTEISQLIPTVQLI
jgi:hypothetical protein